MRNVVAKSEHVLSFVIDEGGEKGRVVDMEHLKIYPLIALQSIFTRGSWILVGKEKHEEVLEFAAVEVCKEVDEACGVNEK